MIRQKPLEVAPTHRRLARACVFTRVAFCPLPVHVKVLSCWPAQVFERAENDKKFGLVVVKDDK